MPEGAALTRHGRPSTRRIVRFDAAIRAGRATRVDWHVARHVAGEEEWECEEVEALSGEATRISLIRKDLADIAEMIERVDDLIVAQETILGLPG